MVPWAGVAAAAGAGEERRGAQAGAVGRRAPGFKAWGGGDDWGGALGAELLLGSGGESRGERGGLQGAGRGSAMILAAARASTEGEGQYHLCRSHRLSDEPLPRIVWFEVTCVKGFLNDGGFHLEPARFYRVP